MRGGAEVARWAHNPKVIGSSPIPATKEERSTNSRSFFLLEKFRWSKVRPDSNRDDGYRSDCRQDDVSQGATYWFRQFYQTFYFSKEISKIFHVIIVELLGLIKTDGNN